METVFGTYHTKCARSKLGVYRSKEKRKASLDGTMIVSFPILDDTLLGRIIMGGGMVSGLMPTFIVNLKSLRDVSRSAVYRYNTPQ